MTPEEIPPEPVVTSDGVRLFNAESDGYGELQVESVELGTWECQRCGTRQNAPVNNGELQEPGECAGCDRNGPYEHAGDFEDTDIQAALRAADMWHPPGGIVDGDRGDIWDRVRAFIHEHWDAEDDELYDGLTAYALSTWFRPKLTFVPHLMLMGKTTGGKTRLLNTLARVSYRAIVSASATPASLYRMIDAYDVSFFVSEYHGLSQEAQRELDNVVRAGQKSGEKVTRAEPAPSGFEPEVFDPFSHIGIATQYTPDDDIVNRCIEIRTKPAREREMPATLDEATAEMVRNELLYHRFEILQSDEWETAEERAFGYLAKNGIRGRTREKLLSLVTVAILWDRLDDIKPFVEVVVEQDKEAEANSEDAQFVQAVRDLLFDAVGSTTDLDPDNDPYAGVKIPYSDVADEFFTHTGMEKSATWVGHVCSRLDIKTARKRDGTVIEDPRLKDKIKRLCDEHNLPWEPSDVYDPVAELPENEQYQLQCALCGADRKATHRLIEEGDYVCQQCATEEREAKGHV